MVMTRRFETGYFWMALCLCMVMTACSHRSDNYVPLENLILDGCPPETEVLLDSLFPAASAREMPMKDFYRYAIHAVRCDSTVFPDYFGDMGASFEKHGNAQQAAFAYYLEGYSAYHLKNIKLAASALKNAEKAAGETPPYPLDFQISRMLFYLNHFYGDKTVADKYADKLERIATREHDTVGIFRAISFQTAVMMDKGRKRDAIKLMETALDLSPGLDSASQGRMYNNLGYVLMDSSITLARHYLLKSLAVYPTNSTYANLAAVYAKQGDVVKSDSLWALALQTDDLQLKAEILSDIFQTKSALGEFKDANDAAGQLMAVKDSISQNVIDGNVAAEQLRVEYENDKNVARSRIISLAWGLVVCTLLMGMAALYFIYRKRKLGDERMRERLYVEALNTQIKKLTANIQSAEMEISERAAEIKRLNKLTTELKTKYAEIYSNGQMKYESLLSGGNISQWKKKDIDDCVEYFGLQEMSYLISLDAMYDGLTNKNRLFLILQHIGKDDNDIQAIFGVGPNAIRTLRSRIKAKLRQ